jgi:acetyl-CoA decarbonylase/synthase, CODH/ACS complex subunit delta
MNFTIPKEAYDGRLNEVVLGTGSKTLTIGGDDAYPFHFFEGELPHPPVFALEVYDLAPEDWPAAIFEPFADVAGDPIGWAKKCVEPYGAEVLTLHLVNPDATTDQSADLVKAVSESVDVPLIIYGAGNEKKDASVMAKVAEVCSGKNLFLGPVQSKNIEEMAKAAKAHGHGLIVKTPLEHGLAREVNIRLKEFLPANRILCDPTSMAVGYGIEFSFTVLQRFQQAALLVNDSNMQMPLISFIGKECWSVAEARQSRDQGLAWEAVSAMALVLAGANLVVLRHPETHQLLKNLIRKKSGARKERIHEK